MPERFELVTVAMGGHDVGIGYERRWALHERADTRPPVKCPTMDYFEDERGVWTCPECGAVKALADDDEEDDS